MQEFATFAVFNVVSVVAIGYIASRGWLRADALSAGPRRDVKLTPGDIFFTFVIIFLCMIALGQLWLIFPHPADEIMSLAVQSILAQIIVLLPAVGYVLTRAGMQPRGLRHLGAVLRHPRAEVLAGFGAVVLIFPVVAATNILITIIGSAFGYVPPEIGHKLLTNLTHLHSPAATLLMVLSAVVIAPLLEETLYRGLVQTALQNMLGQRLRWLSITCAAAIFAVCHLGSVPPPVLAGLFVLGLAFGWLYERTGSLLPGVTMHAAFNAVNIALVLTGKFS